MFSFRKRTPKVNNAENPLLEKAYMDKFGNYYYQYIDITMMPAARVLACERAARFAAMYISERTLREAFKAMRDAGSKGDWVTVFSLQNEIEYRFEYLGETESILDVSSMYFFMQDENPLTVYEKQQAKKIELWQQDPEALNFFLHEGMLLTETYSKQSPQDTLDYLKQNEENEKRLRRYIYKQPSTISTSRVRK